MAPPRIPLEQRFWGKVVRGTPDECWTWIGGHDHRGYGYLRLPGRSGGQTGAHRVAWMLANGDLPEGCHVLHRCDTPSCVNPRHLFLGTNYENVQDKVAKGRQAVRARSGYRGVYYDAAGRIYADIDRRHPSGRRIRMRKHFATEAEADAWRRRKLSEI
jgi:hypothetical protein